MQRLVPENRVSQIPIAEKGLSPADVRFKRSQFGLNIIAEEPESRTIDLFKNTFKDPMLWFLLFVASLFAWIGDLGQASILFLAFIPLAGMDAFLHWRTAVSTKGLKSRLVTMVEAMRDGRFVLVSSVELVPGDVIKIRAGSYVPADGVIVDAHAVQLDESPLTGESLPISKSSLMSLPLERTQPVHSKHWAWAGTKVLVGDLTLIVVYTGSETYYGEIIKTVALTTQEQTRLQRSINQLVKQLVIIAAILCVILAIARLFQGKGMIDALVSSVTLAVAAIPEEFPVAFTFFLGVGVYRMARRNALVRRAVSVENIGRVTCICTDKTGTITEGRLRLTHLVPAQGYHEEDVRKIAIKASPIEISDPIDRALYENFNQKISADRVAHFPFTESRRKEVVVYKKNDIIQIVVKGAPETIFALSQNHPEELRKYKMLVEELADDGHKVLGCAERVLKAISWNGEEPIDGFTFIGLLAFEDPARQEVPPAIAACREANIHVLMITGDHPKTAAAIARDIGLGGATPRVYTADDPGLASCDAAFLASIDVVARAMPSQKLSIVKLLKSSGNIVAVTGDGINDIPALKEADVGIAMGERGTKGAREVAAIVLADDNFASVVAAIAEGRQLFENLRLSFHYLLIVHIPLVLTAAIIPFFGSPLLYLPIHIVWLELVIHPTALLSFQNVASASLSVGTPPTSLSIFSRRDWVAIASSGILISLAVASVFLWQNIYGDGLDQARTMSFSILLMSTSISAGVLNRLRIRSARVILFLSLAFVIVFAEVTVFSRVFHLCPLTFSQWSAVISLSVFCAAPLFLRRLKNIVPNVLRIQLHRGSHARSA